MSETTKTSAELRADLLRSAKADAWDEGRNAGVANCVAIIGWGARGASKSQEPVTTSNPYRDAGATS